MERDELSLIFVQAAQVRAGLADPTLPSDPVMTEMVRLSGIPPGERYQGLEPYLTRWAQDGETRLRVARYLAAAGLTLEEARVALLRFQTRATDELRRHARRDLIQAFGAFGAGALVLVLVYAFKQQFPAWGVIVMGAVVAGLVLFSRAMTLRRRITAASNDDFGRGS